MTKSETKKSKVHKISSKDSFRNLSYAFYEASKISFSLVFYPIVLLLLGVWLDKRFGTIPLFIIAGVISGVVLGIYKATRIRLTISKKGEEKNG